MQTATRFVLILLLCTTVVGAGMHYSTTVSQHRPYPSGDDLATDYAKYIGESTLLFGTVESVDSARSVARISVLHSAGTIEFVVTGFDATVEQGASVQVYGEIEENKRVTATRTVVVNRSEDSLYYKYVISAVGAALVLLSFFHHWTITLKKLSFEAR